MPYSDGFKARMVKRLAGPHALSANALSREVGVPQSTLSMWLREARTLPDMGKEKQRTGHDSDPNSARSPRSWSASEKLRVVLDASRIAQSDLGAFLRREGIHEAQLIEWQRAVLAGLDGKERIPSGEKKALLVRRIKELERELRSKEKELTEAKVLLELKKKLEMLWGDEADDTATRRET